MKTRIWAYVTRSAMWSLDGFLLMFAVVAIIYVLGH